MSKNHHPVKFLCYTIVSNIICTIQSTAFSSFSGKENTKTSKILLGLLEKFTVKGLKEISYIYNTVQRDKFSNALKTVCEVSKNKVKLLMIGT